MYRLDTFHWLSPSIFAILIHVALETPAGLNFIFRPWYTLGSPSPAALPVIRQYGLILLVLNGVLLLLLAHQYQNASKEGMIASTSYDGLATKNVRDNEQLMGRMCGVLSIYHMGPLLRAIGKRGQKAMPGVTAYGGPTIVIIAHGITLAVLLGAWLLS